MDDPEALTDFEELSDAELDELMVTNYVSEEQNKKNIGTKSASDELEIECARSVATPLDLCLSPIGFGDCALLEDYPCLRRPIDELKIDGATLLLNNILEASERELKSFRSWDLFETSKRWKKTSRTTELALAEWLLESVDARPVHLHLFCRRLTESDVMGAVRKALEAESPSKYRSLLRLTVKTDMPMRQFLAEVDNLGKSFDGRMLLLEGRVTAVQKVPGVKHDQKFSTGDLRRLAELEHVLANQRLHSMNGSVKLMLGLVGKEHLSVRVDFHNEIEPGTTRRTKTIVIEQLATPPRGVLNERRVSFAPADQYELIEFEIEGGAPLHPLRYPTKIYDVIEHLERAHQQMKKPIRH